MSARLPADEAAPRAAGRRRRIWMLAAVAVLALAVVLGYAGREAGRARAVAQTPSGAASLEALPEPATDGGAVRPYVLFRHGAPDQHHGRLALQYLDDLSGARAVAPLACDRVHLAAGLGICLQAKRGMLTTYEALVFDRRFRVLHRLPLAGPPSRARLSADGRLAAVTVFLAGHSYAGASFTTRTAVLDTASGHWVVEDLEGFEVLREGRPMKASGSTAAPIRCPTPDQCAMRSRVGATASGGCCATAHPAGRRIASSTIRRTPFRRWAARW